MTRQPYLHCMLISRQDKNLNIGIKIGDTEISILMYADHIILLAETQEGIQCMLSELHTWCKSWRMTVNTEKTQIIHFRPEKIAKNQNLVSLWEFLNRYC